MSDLTIKSDLIKKSVGVFTGENFRVWSAGVRRILKPYEYGLEVLDGESDGGESEQSVYQQLDAEISAALIVALSPEIQASIPETASAAEIWDLIKKTYGARLAGDRIALMEQLYSLKFDSSVTELNQRFGTLVLDIAGTGEKLSAKDQVLHYLRIIKDRAPHEFSYWDKQNNPLLPSIQNALLSAERNGTLVQPSLVFASTSSGVTKPTANRAIQCHKCHGFGHLMHKCPTSIEVDDDGFIQQFGNMSMRGRGGRSYGGRGHGGYRGYRGRGGHRGNTANVYAAQFYNDSNIENSFKYFSTSAPQDEKTLTPGPVHPKGESLPMGLDALKSDNLRPCSRGPFGLGPPKRGSVEDMLQPLEVVNLHSVSDPVSPQESSSLLAHDPSHKIFIDSGATDTVTPLQHALTNFIPVNIQINLAANGSKSSANGRGALTLRFHGQENDFDLRVPSVILDPRARSTYLSTGSLQQLGITTLFPGDSSWCILVNERSKSEICRGRRYAGQLYEMPISVLYPDSPLYTAKLLTVEAYAALHHALGHLRCGHVNGHDLSTLVREGKLKDVKPQDLKEPLFCIGCKLGKASQLPYNQPPREKVTIPGGKVHVDIWGPARISGYKGERYVLFLTDEATQSYCGKFLKTKDQAAGHIKLYKAHMEKQFENFKLKCLRSDNAGEILMSKDMHTWMAEHGIKHEESPPHTPQYNGKAERTNRTIMDPVRSIMALGKLRPSLWPEVVSAVVHIKNRLPSKALGGRIPREVLTGKSVSIDHFRVIGCDAYVLNKASGRDKLAPKSAPCILVGYGTDSSTYRLYDPAKRTVVISRDVVFNEEGFIRANYLPYRDFYGDPTTTKESFGLPSELPQSPPPSPLIIEADDEDEDPPTSQPLAPVPSVAVSHDDTNSSRSTSPDPLTDPSFNPPEFVGQPSVIIDPPLLEDDGLPDELVEAEVGWITLETTDKIPVPKTFGEMLESQYFTHWWAAMKEEVDALVANGTWTLVNRSDALAKTIITGKWVWDSKPLAGGKIRFKARWVARGFTQIEGLDYKETFAPVMHGKSWHIMFALAARMRYETMQIDVANAFLNGNLTEKIYMEMPRGFEQANYICELKKSLYGLKQAAHVWFEELKRILTEEMGFKQLVSDPVMFTKELAVGKLMVGGHVDDLLPIAPSMKDLELFRDELATRLKLKSFPLSTYLGVETTRDAHTGTITIHHYKKISELLEEQGMAASAPVSTALQPNVHLSRGDCPPKGQQLPLHLRSSFRSAVGALMHIMIMTRPDICVAVKVLSEALDNPSEKHFQALKWLLRYLNGTRGFGITYYGRDDPKCKESSVRLDLHGFYDADWGGDEFDRKSRCGYVFLLSGGAISWWSGKQEIVASSTTHAEYIGQDAASRELEWILQFLGELNLSPNDIPAIYGRESAPSLYGDNQPAQNLAKNPVNHRATKHFDIKLHRIRELLHNKVFRLLYVPSKMNTADILTKCLDKSTFEFHRTGMGISRLLE